MTRKRIIALTRSAQRIAQAVLVGAAAVGAIIVLSRLIK